MKKVNWRWDWGLYVPFCPYCDEPAYEEDHCLFCNKEYEWVEGKYKPTKVEHEGYTIVQETNNHIQLYKDGEIILFASCEKKMSEDELKEMIERYKKKFEEDSNESQGQSR